MMNDDRNSAGSGSYVLDAMDENEREEFEARMSESEELRNEVTELTDTAVLLGLAIDPVTPPPALKQNIMAMLSQTPQLAREPEAEDATPVRRLHAVPSLVSTDAAPSHPAHSASATAAKTATRWYTRPATIVLGAAAAIAIIVGGITTTNLVTENSVSSQNASALATLNTASDVQRAAASVSTGGTATLVWSNKLGKSVLIGKNLAALPGGKTYELWYIGAKGATPAGTFQSSGASTVQELTGTMAKGDTVGITVEPAGGSKTPTTTPIVAIKSV